VVVVVLLVLFAVRRAEEGVSGEESLSGVVGRDVNVGRRREVSDGEGGSGVGGRL
jgi:hypothetical protein